MALAAVTVSEGGPGLWGRAAEPGRCHTWQSARLPGEGAWGQWREQSRGPGAGPPLASRALGLLPGLAVVKGQAVCCGETTQNSGEQGSEGRLLSCTGAQGCDLMLPEGPTEEGSRGPRGRGWKGPWSKGRRRGGP